MGFLKRFVVCTVIVSTLSFSLIFDQASAAPTHINFLPLNQVLSITQGGCTFQYVFGTFGQGYANVRISRVTPGYTCIAGIKVAVFHNGQMKLARDFRYVGGSAPTGWITSSHPGAGFGAHLTVGSSIGGRSTSNYYILSTFPGQ